MAPEIDRNWIRLVTELVLSEWTVMVDTAEDTSAEADAGHRAGEEVLRIAHSFLLLALAGQES